MSGTLLRIIDSHLKHFDKPPRHHELEDLLVIAAIAWNVDAFQMSNNADREWARATREHLHARYPKKDLLTLFGLFLSERRGLFPFDRRPVATVTVSTEEYVQVTGLASGNGPIEAIEKGFEAALRRLDGTPKQRR